MLGIVNLRGQILSLIDLNVLLRLPRSSRAEGMVLVLRSDEMEMGVVADAFEGVQRLPRGGDHLLSRRCPVLARPRCWGSGELVLDAGRILKDRSLVVSVEGPEEAAKDLGAKKGPITKGEAQRMAFLTCASGKNWPWGSGS